MFSSLLLLFFFLFTGDIPAKYIAAGLGLALCLSLAWMQHEEDRERLAALPEEIASRVLNAQKRRRGEERNNPAAKRAYLGWNRERARACVEEDYWGPHPRFRDRDFERVFRISRTRAEEIMTLLGNAHPFFRNTVDCRGEPSICPKVKFLMALKLVCYGVSPAAFQDYFQMGKSTAHDCLKHFSRIVSQDDDLKLKYRRRMNRADAPKLSDLHFYHHGVQGMVGS